MDPCSIWEQAICLSNPLQFDRIRFPIYSSWVKRANQFTSRPATKIIWHWKGKKRTALPHTNNNNGSGNLRQKRFRGKKLWCRQTTALSSWTLSITKCRKEDLVYSVCGCARVHLLVGILSAISLFAGGILGWSLTWKFIFFKCNLPPIRQLGQILSSSIERTVQHGGQLKLLTFSFNDRCSAIWQCARMHVIIGRTLLLD